MSTELSVIPANLALPAHLQTPEAAAEIAAANAAAAGGIKAGGFSQISIKANKFHIKENGELSTLMDPPSEPGSPATPKMCLKVVVVGANPALNKTYYEGEYVEGADPKDPECRSSNGVTPDADAQKPQHTVCATCPKNQWGSKVSKISGKDVKACDDSKQLAILPADDLTFKALGLLVHKGSLKNWGRYVDALNGRGYPITGVVTNVTFDATSNGVLNFAFNRFLSAEESAKAKERATGSDVKLIVSQTRTLVPALPAPASTVALPGVSTQAAAPATPASPPPTPPAPAAPPAATTGFGATAPATQPPAAPAAEQPAATTRKRRTREQIAADEAAAKTPGINAIDPALVHLPPAILAAVQAVGKDTDAGKALLLAYPAPAPVIQTSPVTIVAVDPYAGQPPHVKMAVDGAGGLSTPDGVGVYKALTGKEPPTTETPAAVVVQSAANPPPALVGGFGATTPAAPAAGNTPPSAAVVQSAANLKDKLTALLAKKAA